ncbi:MAG: hypothetical protein Q7S34_03375 [bacterium]|nr:hypothetical protein [bacterium]
MPQIARCTETVEGFDGILYRHTISGGTKFAVAGETLPVDDDGVWEPLASDNFADSEVIPIQITVYAEEVYFDAGFLPETGIRFNLRNTVYRIDTTLIAGLFEIVDMRETTVAKKKYLYQIIVDRIGEIDPTKLIYEMRPNIE